MSFPDLVIEIYEKEIIAALPTKDNIQKKSFTPSWDGAAALAEWLQDIGMKESFIRLMVVEGSFGSTALIIADKLGKAGHVVMLKAQ